ncbi:hypothetical protein [Clostridium sp.]|uniref:hypothetical protein n=1 Tax=Clostridium sp. TaxID=1506 RepID=UPI0032176368
MAISMGSFTITDLNDATSLTGFIGSNLAKTQVYNPDTGSFSPNWSVTNLILTPELYIAGTTSNKITDANVQQVLWYQGNSSSPIVSGEDYLLSGTKSHILTIKSNILSTLNIVDLTCVITYRDSFTDLVYTHKMSITFTKVSSGGGIADAIASTPNGNVFKNLNTETLTATCDLWRGSNVDLTNISYQWFIQDSSITVDQGGGIGWKKLIDTANLYTGCTSREITIYNDAVTGIGVFKCIIKDIDSSSGSYNQLFTDTVTIIDISDPIQVVIESTGGDVFKNGTGSTILTARLFQAGNEIDAISTGNKYTYKWYKYDKDGQLVTGFGGSSIDYKTGKTLNVGTVDVDVKATFKVEVS